MQDLIEIPSEYLEKLDVSVPRYTSYPTAPFFEDLSPTTYLKALQDFKDKDDPISLYIHIPFCAKMCLFCACSVTLNRSKERQKNYVRALLKEIELISQKIGTKRITQLHFGGGTPTSLDEEDFYQIFVQLQKRLFFDPKAEISIEVDPRTVFSDQGKKLTFLRTLFNRVSFGVQDVEERVQEAVKRRQSKEMTEHTFYKARELAFESINMDLIYGLPFQTAATFKKSAKTIVDMGPDRIALFSYAKVPWLKPHQKAIRDQDLPSREEKFQIYLTARRIFMEAGYQPIGMDHFAKKEDPLTTAYHEKKLMRNFQGYSLQLSNHMIGLGSSSIGFVNGVYAQNKKEPKEYEEALLNEELPVFRGKVLSSKDLLLREVIQRIMCDFEVNLENYPLTFTEELKKLSTMQELVQVDGKRVRVTPTGRLFVRNIAAVFDSYLKNNQSFKGYSKSV